MGAFGPQVELPELKITRELVVGQSDYLSELGPGSPGGVLVIEQGGQVRFQEAFGAARLRPSELCRHDTLFRLKEVEHCVVRLLAVRVARDKGLPLESPLSSILPSLAKASAGCTIEDLVFDRARLVNLETLFYFRRRDELGVIDTQGAMAALGRMGRGADKAHRPTNSVVLRAVLEAASGRPLSELMDRHVLQPAGVPLGRWIERAESSSAHRAIRYRKEKYAAGWSEDPVLPLTVDAGALWLGASEALSVARLLYQDPVAAAIPGLLVVERLGGPRLALRTAPVVYFESADLFVAWMANEQSRASRGVGCRVGQRLMGRPGHEPALGFGGGAAAKYGGRFGRSPFDGRWPEGEYNIPEIEQRLQLSMDSRGKLQAHTPGVELGSVTIASRPEGGGVEGTFYGRLREAPSSIRARVSGDPIMIQVRDSITIRFNRTGGRLVPVAVTLKRSGQDPCSLEDLTLEKRP